MAICRETCACHISGARGLETNALGDTLHPYTAGPGTDRTVPTTVATAASLPALADEEAGATAFVEDTGLVYVYCVLGDTFTSGWQVLASDWAFLELPDLSLPVSSVGVTSQGIALGPGRWDVVAVGHIEVDTEPGRWHATAVQLVDATSGTVYETRKISVANETGAVSNRAAAFLIQAVISSGLGSTSLPAGADKVVALRPFRQTSDDGSGSIRSARIRAIRVASHSVF